MRVGVGVCWGGRPTSKQLLQTHAPALKAGESRGPGELQLSADLGPSSAPDLVALVVCGGSPSWLLGEGSSQEAPRPGRLLLGSCSQVAVTAQKRTSALGSAT